MAKNKFGLALEGGGMRGAYTLGVLDAFMDNELWADYVVGVSAGAGNGASYISRQRGRGYRLNTKFLADKRYISLSNFIKTKSFFGMDFIFREIPDVLDIYDYDKMMEVPCEFVVGTTNVETGKPEYYTKEALYHDLTVLAASSSLPIFSPIVEYNGKKLLDGGTSDPIPVKKALEDGCGLVVTVLTRPRGFVKTPEKFRAVYRSQLKKYPEMVRVLDERHIRYNETLRDIERLEADGKILVIAPSRAIKISRFEKNAERLEELYRLGYDDAAKKLPEILNKLKLMREESN